MYIQCTMLVLAFANIFWWFMNYFLMFLESSPVTDGITKGRIIAEQGTWKSKEQETGHEREWEMGMGICAKRE